MAGTRNRRRGSGALAVLLVLSLIAASTTGCGAGRDTADGGRQEADNPGRHGAGRETAWEDDGAGPLDRLGRAIVKFEKIGDLTYADAGKLAGLIGFRAEFSEDGKSLFIGDHDVVLTITDQSREVVKEERTLTMSQPARRMDGRMLVPSNELKKLFGEEALFTVDATQAAIFPKPPRKDKAAVNNFADDTTDSAEDAPWSAHSGDNASVPANVSALIKEAKRYLGVKYEFGAAHYSTSKRFDCSSFVQYLFAKQGVEMPRTARAQALKGKEVTRDKLRQGDLLFFRVPGRFKDDTTVGHVGIYIGDQKMIHSSPLPQDGVQITDINKAYWKETFLFAKRVL